MLEGSKCSSVWSWAISPYVKIVGNIFLHDDKVQSSNLTLFLLWNLWQSFQLALDVLNYNVIWQIVKYLNLISHFISKTIWQHMFLLIMNFRNIDDFKNQKMHKCFLKLLTQSYSSTKNNNLAISYPSLPFAIIVPKMRVLLSLYHLSLEYIF